MAYSAALPKSGSRDIRWVIILLLFAGILSVAGWRLFWHLTDDAYISFRYVSNSILGYGYVWNSPPFRPVEGYTNFLWVVLLDVIWRVLGVTPPKSANYLTLLFSFSTLILVSWSVLRIKWTEQLHRYRILLLGLVLLAITTNRTFLAWTSSGLETAMFNFLLILWICFCFLVPSWGFWWGFSITSAAACMSLTRPDGLLFLAATVLILCWPSHRRQARRSYLERLAGAFPVLAVLIHLIWRRATYGQWLPNTFYAKYTGLWPESGIRYALSFVLEYGLWVWLALVAYLLFRKAKAHLNQGRSGGDGRKEVISDTALPSQGNPGRIIVSAVCLTLVLHAFFYTFVIGGDHFEYRVYSHLILVIPPSFLWLCNAVRLRAAVSIALFVSFMILSYPTPWTHWALTRNLNTKQETTKLRVSVSDNWPPCFAWYARPFDQLQFWLIDHYVCIRHQEHKVNCEFIKSLFPSREEGLLLASDHYPVFTFPAVGVVSWVLPEINIIDLHGLNDYVIARTPPNRSRLRTMAHEKQAPEGYADCFAPNVRLLEGGRIVISRRQNELKAEDIERCEKTWARRVGGSGDSP